MKESISSDKPISNREEDRFQRHGFAARIAQAISQRASVEGIVMSLNGRWGEGKTSVLNLIRNELNKDESIVLVQFNPWRYDNSDALIKNFLRKVADALGQELETRKERFGEFILKYGSFGAPFGKDLSEIGKILADVGLESLKERIDELIQASGKKLVIFIDDIDRLDKSEIFSLFKLVKLTADFTRTTYVLSFDEEMVASAIGENFGDGNPKSGLEFLEKIIQIPLTIPQAQTSALKQYCFELIDISLSETQITLTNEEAREFTSEFSQNLLPRLKSPRLAIRYANSLTFAFPLLKGEVNYVDLMLIEALKVFYPEHYNLIKSSPHYFISSYSTNGSYSNEEDIKKKKEELVSQLNNLSEGFSSSERNSIFSILKTLFPRLNEVFHNTFEYQGAVNWYKEKKIVSPHYFKRYFSYAVIEGELSDVAFDEFMAEIPSNSVDLVVQEIENIIQFSSVDDFIRKIRNYEDEMDLTVKQKVLISLSRIGHLQSEEDSFFGFGGSRSQLCIFITKLLENHKDVSESLELAKRMLGEYCELEFAYDIYYWLGIGKNKNEKVFSPDQENELSSTLVNRTLEESLDKPVFENFPEQAWYFFQAWADYNITEAEDYIFEVLNKEPEKTKEFVKSLTSTIRSSNHPYPYKIDLSQENYHFIISLSDKDFLYKQILEVYQGELEKEEVRFFDRENKQTEINILRQFIYWYNKEKEGLK